VSNGRRVAGYCAENAAVVVQVVATAIPGCADPDDISCTVRAFMELTVELIEMLVKIILEPSPFSNNKNLQKLLALTAISSHKATVDGDITKLENNDRWKSRA